MLSLRLQRTGRKNFPSFRLIVCKKTQDPWGKNLEILGHYNPRLKTQIELNAERIKHWISQGAQASVTVWNLLVEQKIVEGKKRSTTHLSKTRRGKLEAEVVAEKAKQEEKKAKQAAAKEAEAAAKAEAEAKAKEEAEAAAAAAKAQAEAPAQAPAAEEPKAE